MNYLLVALGGAFGSVLRYWAGFIFSFPFGTLTVNILGSLAMGLAYGLLSEKGLERASLLLMVGFLGGFTTFSSFNLDFYNLIEASNYLQAIIYVSVSVIGSIILFFVGLNFVKFLF